MDEVTDGRSLAHDRRNREPLIVLDADMRVIVASRSFSASKQEIQGRMLELATAKETLPVASLSRRCAAEQQQRRRL